MRTGKKGTVQKYRCLYIILWSCFYIQVDIMIWEGVNIMIWGEQQMSVGRSLEGRGVEAVAWSVRVVKWVQCICNQQRQQREGASTEGQTSCLVPIKPFIAKMLLSLPQLPPVADCSFGISQARVPLFSSSSSSWGAGSVGEGRQQMDLPSILILG